LLDARVLIMKIIDLTPEFEDIYFCCLEDWSEEVREAGNHKACWYGKMKDRGLRVKLAQDDSGTIGGMIQYLPIEASFAEGNDLFIVLCIWIHGHKQGRGNHQKKGMGKALLQAAEEDARKSGAKGLVTWGIILPFFMKAAWFRKRGYKTVDKSGIMRLMWKPFSEDARPPAFIKQKKTPVLIPGKVHISMFLTGWCPAQNIVHERTKRAIADFSDKIVIDEYSTFEKGLQREWGISDAVFVDRKEVPSGPPASYKKIRKIVEKKVKALRD
jgi:GNAT superfamily N-acetyltransferase